MFLIPAGRAATFGLKPMNCPGHMLLFGERAPELPRAAVPVRRGSTLHRNELAGTLHGLTARPPRHPGRRAHLLHAGADRGRDLRLPRLRVVPLRAVRAASYTFELSTRPENKLGTDEEWDFTEAALQAALERRGLDVRAERGRRRVLRAEDRPPHDRLARPLMADGDDPARRADAAALRPHLHGRRQQRAHAVRHPPRAPRLARAVHRDPHRALRGRLPVLARAGAGARPAGRRRACRRRAALVVRLRDAGFRAEVDEPTETIGKRIRAAELEKIPVTIVYGDKESDEQPRGARTRRRAIHALVARSARAACYPLSLKSRGGPVPHLPALQGAGRFNRVRTTRKRAAA